MEPSQKNYDSDKETTRLVSFSDGVFAIAITLLILDIHVPDVQPNKTLLESLSTEWPSFLALLIGFFTILICWINHHYMYKNIVRSNSILSLINGFKLLIVTITPFATALLSKHIQTSWEVSAVNIYCLNFAFMGLAMAGIWCYANRKGFTRAHSTKVLQATTRLYLFAVILSTTIWIVSFFSILGCLILFCIMFIIFVYPEEIVKWQVTRIKDKDIKVATEV